MVLPNPVMWKIIQLITNSEPSANIPKIQPLVAGIDVGSENHYVCAPTSDGGTEMRVFGATTPDLLEIAAWFQQLGVVSVALESTGVYWIPLFEVLDNRGIEVILTDTRQLSRVPGRKTEPRIASGSRCCTAADCSRIVSGRRMRSAICGPWCGARRFWWRSAPIGCAACRKASTR